MRFTCAIPILLLALILSGCQGSKSDKNSTTSDSKSVLIADFVNIPAGRFVMGSPESELGREGPEGPQHTVTLSSFQIMSTELTQNQWNAVMGITLPIARGDSFPIGNVNCDDIQGFIEKLNILDPGKGYRLPTEAEWEYACRAGSTGSYCFGNNAENLDEYAWLDVRRDHGVRRVGQKRPNAWGIYDMHGNAYEWCADEYTAYKAGDQVDPLYSESPNAIIENRVFRSGGFTDPIRSCRSAYRSGLSPWARMEWIGFRLVRLAQ